MSKIKAALLGILSDGKWHQTSELIGPVCKSCRTNRANVSNTLSTLCGGHHIVKEHITGAKHNSCRYRLANEQAGFGVSPVMADFNQLLRAARGNHANDMVLP